LKNFIAEFLVVVGVDVFQRGEKPEMRLLARKFLSDAENELLEQLA